LKHFNKFISELINASKPVDEEEKEGEEDKVVVVPVFLHILVDGSKMKGTVVSLSGGGRRVALALYADLKKQ
jgi:hypothetical protein